VATLFGCALGALLIPAFTVLQERTTPESRGRIFGGIFTVINAAVAIPLLLAGVISDVLGVDRVVAALGVLLLLLGAAIRTVGWHRLAVLEADPVALAVVDAEG
jgi:MFS family permease